MGNSMSKMLATAAYLGASHLHHAYLSSPGGVIDENAVPMANHVFSRHLTEYGDITGTRPMYGDIPNIKIGGYVRFKDPESEEDLVGRVVTIDEDKTSFTVKVVEKEKTYHPQWSDCTHVPPPPVPPSTFKPQNWDHAFAYAITHANWSRDVKTLLAWINIDWPEQKGAQMPIPIKEAYTYNFVYESVATLALYVPPDVQSIIIIHGATGTPPTDVDDLMMTIIYEDGKDGKHFAMKQGKAKVSVNGVEQNGDYPIMLGTDAKISARLEITNALGNLPLDVAFKDPGAIQEMSSFDIQILEFLSFPEKS